MTDPTAATPIGSASVLPAEDWKRELSEVFFSRKKIILWVTVITTVCALLIALLWPPTYAATGSILLRGKMPQISPGLLETPEIRTPDVSEEDVTSELEILNAPDLIQRTVERLQKTGQGFAQGDEAGEELAARIRGNLKAEAVPSSNVIQVTLYDKDPERAETILDALLNEYISYRQTVFNPADQAGFFTGRADMYRTQLETIEDQLLASREGASPELLQQQIEQNIILRNDLAQRLYELKAELAVKKADLAPLEAAIQQDSVQFFAFLPNESMTQLGTHLAELIVERGRILRDFQPESPKARSVAAQIEQTYQLLQKEAMGVLQAKRVEVESLEQAVRQLEESIDELSEQNRQMQGDLVALSRLTRQAEVLESSYQTYAKRSEEARINAAIADASLSADISILGGAKESAFLVYPKPLLTILLGIVAGIIGGCTLAFLMEYLDHTLKRPSDVHRELQLPVLCSVRKVS